MKEEIRQRLNKIIFAETKVMEYIHKGGDFYSLEFAVKLGRLLGYVRKLAAILEEEDGKETIRKQNTETESNKTP